MTTFAVGEIAIGQNFIQSVSRNGMGCEILSGIQQSGWTRCRATGVLLPSSACHFVRWADGAEGFVTPDKLRKRRPPSTDESESRQAMLDCIERARRPVGVPA